MSCPRHPAARQSVAGCSSCLGNARTNAYRARRVAAGLPAQPVPTDAQRARKRERERANYALEAERIKAAQRDRYHAQMLAKELAELAEREREQAQERWARYKVAHRMDPTGIPRWQVGQQPRPFWYDPARQTVGIGDDRVWCCFPIHDPAWSW